MGFCFGDAKAQRCTSFVLWHWQEGEMACVTTGGGRGISTGVRKNQTTRETVRRCERGVFIAADCTEERTTGLRLTSRREGGATCNTGFTVGDKDPSREARCTLAPPSRTKSAHSPHSVSAGRKNELARALPAATWSSQQMPSGDEPKSMWPSVPMQSTAPCPSIGKEMSTVRIDVRIFFIVW